MAAGERASRSCSRWHVQALLAAAALAALLHTTAAQTTLDITDSFQDYNVVPAGRSLFYDFVAYNYTAKTIPDVLVTLKSSGAVDTAPFLYCNPAWYSATPGNSQPGPSNAVYKSEEAVLPNTIFIDAGADVNWPESSRDLKAPGHDTFVPAYNCSVVSNDAFIGTRFTIDVAFQYRNVQLIEEEQQLMQRIWDQCCKNEVNATTRRVVATGDGENLVENTIDDYRCGRWAQNNAIYGGDPTTAFTDFCQIAGNACTPQGRLYKLDMNSYGLVCPFPVDEFAGFLDLESLDLSDNFDITGPATDLFRALSTLQFLQILDLSGVKGLAGPLVAGTAVDGEAPLCLLASSRLKVLNLAEIRLPDSTLPGCLFSGSSNLEELRLEFSQLSGSIPDVFMDNSPLRVFSALSSGLSGTIPESLTLCKDLEIVDLAYNELSGSIPEQLGNSNQRYLRFVYLQSNNLTGAIPEPLALAPPLEALDVSENRLSGIPASWVSATTARISASPLRNIKLSVNLFSAPFPKVFPLLPNLVLLQIDNNRFTGTLPGVPGMFKELRVFNATRNVMSGTLPAAFGAAGIFRLDQINSLGVQQLENGPPDPDQGSTLAAQPQIFDVSSNAFSGAVPNFLYANNVKTFVRPTVNIRYNKLTVRCTGEDAPGQLQYLADATHLCPQYPPPGALAGLGESASDASDAPPGTPQQDSGGGSGLPAYGKALISLAVVAVVAAAVGFVALTYVRARSRGEPYTMAHLDPRNFRRRGFKQFNDLEMTSGMDPLGFGPPAAGITNAQLNGMANGSANGANGANGHTLSKSKRGKGGFL